MEKVITKLYDLGVYHIVDHKKTVEVDIGGPLAHSEKLAEILVKLRAVMSQLGITEYNGQKASPKPLTEKDYYELGKKSKQLYLDVVGILDMIKQTKEDIKRTAEKLTVAELFQKLKIEPWMIQESKLLCTFIGTLPEGKSLQGLEKITPHYELVKVKAKAGQVIALFAKREARDAIQALLQKEGFQELPIDPSLHGNKAENTRKTDTLIQEFQKSIQSLSTKLAQAETRLELLRRQHKEFLVSNEAMLREEAKKAEAPLLFGETKRAFTITGWIPAKDVQKVQKELQSVTNNSIYIEESIPDQHDSVPVKLKNALLVKPYEFFLQLYDLPNYKEIDPTMLMFITFPLFFGFMLGDAGYGIVTLLLFLFLRKKFPTMKALLNIMVFAAVISILFGFAFGEYFGFEHISSENGNALCRTTGICLPMHEIESHGELHRIADFPRLLNRAHGHINLGGMEILAVLVIGAIVGVIHLNLAFLLGFYNVWRTHGFLHAIEEKLSWILLETGIVLTVLSMTNKIAIPPLVGWLILGISIFLIYKGEGVQGLVELPSIFSNILSYMRLGAVGLASVGLAVVVNENLTIPYIQKGGIFAVIGIFSFLFGHIINIGLGILGPFLHSLRLHYVEFFSKFYKGGGIAYSPFGRNQHE